MTTLKKQPTTARHTYRTPLKSPIGAFQTFDFADSSHNQRRNSQAMSLRKVEHDMDPKYLSNQVDFWRFKAEKLMSEQVYW